MGSCLIALGCLALIAGLLKGAIVKGVFARQSNGYRATIPHRIIFSLVGVAVTATGLQMQLLCKY